MDNSSNNCYLVIGACTKSVGDSLFMPLLLLDKLLDYRLAFSEECFANVLGYRNLVGQ